MDEDIVHAQTLAFTTIAMFQVLDSSIADQEPNQFSAWLFTNKFLLVAIVAPVSLQVLATQLPFFNVALGTTALSVWQWLPILLISSSVFITDETRKFARNRMKRGLDSQCSSKESDGKRKELKVSLFLLAFGLLLCHFNAHQFYNLYRQKLINIVRILYCILHS